MSLCFLVISFGFIGQTCAGNLLKDPRTELVGIVNPCSPFERRTTAMRRTVLFEDDHLYFQ